MGLGKKEIQELRDCLGSKKASSYSGSAHQLLLQRRYESKHNLHRNITRMFNTKRQVFNQVLLILFICERDTQKKKNENRKT